MSHSQPSPNGSGSSLRDTVMQFGYPIDRFTPGRGRTRLVRVVGLLDTLAGIAVLGWALGTGQPWAMSAVGAALTLSGVALIGVARRMSVGGVLICPRGIVLARSGKVESCLWEQMAEIREASPDPAAAGAGAVAGYVVERRNGAAWTFDAAAVGDLRRFGSVLRKESERHRVPWKS
jgi:hypothetical protein